MAGTLGIQQLTRSQGLVWGDSASHDAHLWFDGMSLNCDVPFVMAPSGLLVPAGTPTGLGALGISGGHLNIGDGVDSSQVIDDDTAAGGGLSGFYPNPTVNAGVVPGGTAGGALAGTYPNPTIASGATLPSPVVTGRLSGARGADVASANNLTLGTDGNVFKITGTTQVNLIDSTGWSQGSIVVLFFGGALTVKNGIASSGAFRLLQLDSGADIIMVSNSTLTLVLAESSPGVSIWLQVAHKA